MQNEEEPSYLNASIDALLAAYLKVLQKVREERPGEGEHVLIARDDVSLRGADSHDHRPADHQIKCLF